MKNHNHRKPEYEPGNDTEQAAGCLIAFILISIFSYIATQVHPGLLALGIIIGLVFLLKAEAP